MSSVYVLNDRLKGSKCPNRAGTYTEYRPWAVKDVGIADYKTCYDFSGTVQRERVQGTHQVIDFFFQILKLISFSAGTISYSCRQFWARSSSWLETSRPPWVSLIKLLNFIKNVMTKYAIRRGLYCFSDGKCSLFKVDCAALGQIGFAYYAVPTAR